MKFVVTIDLKDIEGWLLFGNSSEIIVNVLNWEILLVESKLFGKRGSNRSYYHSVSLAYFKENRSDFFKRVFAISCFLDNIGT